MKLDQTYLLTFLSVDWRVLAVGRSLGFSSQHRFMRSLISGPHDDSGIEARNGGSVVVDFKQSKISVRLLRKIISYFHYENQDRDQRQLVDISKKPLPQIQATRGPIRSFYYLYRIFWRKNYIFDAKMLPFAHSLRLLAEFEKMIFGL